MGIAILPNNAGYDSAKFGSNLSASCGYYSATECRLMDPRTAEMLYELIG